MSSNVTPSSTEWIALNLQNRLRKSGDNTHIPTVILNYSVNSPSALTALIDLLLYRSCNNQLLQSYIYIYIYIYYLYYGYQRCERYIIILNICIRYDIIYYIYISWFGLWPKWPTDGFHAEWRVHFYLFNHSAHASMLITDALLVSAERENPSSSVSFCSGAYAAQAYWIFRPYAKEKKCVWKPVPSSVHIVVVCSDDVERFICLCHVSSEFDLLPKAQKLDARDRFALSQMMNRKHHLWLNSPSFNSLRSNVCLHNLMPAQSHKMQTKIIDKGMPKQVLDSAVYSNISSIV